MERFLQGMRAMDDHYRSAPLQDNLPALLGLLNVSALPSCHAAVPSAILPCCPPADPSCPTLLPSRPLPCPLPADITRPQPPPPRHCAQVWNSTFLGHSTTAILPYQQALQVGWQRTPPSCRSLSLLTRAPTSHCLAGTLARAVPLIAALNPSCPCRSTLRPTSSSCPWSPTARAWPSTARACPTRRVRQEGV